MTLCKWATRLSYRSKIKQSETKSQNHFTGHTTVFVGFPRCKKCCPRLSSSVCLYHCWDYFRRVEVFLSTHPFIFCLSSFQDGVLNPWRTEVFRRYINMYLHFIPSLHSRMTLVVEIRPRRKQEHSKINAIAVDDKINTSAVDALATQGVRAFSAMVLIHIIWNNPESAR